MHLLRRAAHLGVVLFASAQCACTGACARPFLYTQRSPSPDSRFIAVANVHQGSGSFGENPTSYSFVTLARNSSPSATTEVFSTVDDESLENLEIGLRWLSPTSLQVSYVASDFVEIANRRWRDVSITFVERAPHFWSTVGQALRGSTTQREAAAPDRKWSIFRDDDAGLWLRSPAGLRSGLKNQQGLRKSDTEIIWADDSEKFAFNRYDYTDQERFIGQWETYVQAVAAPERAAVSVRAIVQSELAVFSSCKSPVDIGAVSWLDPKSDLLVVAQLRDPSCPAAYSSKGFRVNVEAGRVVEVIAEADLRRRWPKLLGPFLTASFHER